jgi:Ice-binding-like
MSLNWSGNTEPADGVRQVRESLDRNAAESLFDGGSRPLVRKGLVLAAVLGALVFTTKAQALAPVGMGTLESFAVLANTTVTNTGPTIVRGNVGVSPGSAVTGFPPGIVLDGTIHVADGVAAQAQSDLTTAYNDAAGRPCANDLTGQDLGGMNLTTGVYCFDTSAQLTGTLTLQGGPNAVFIFQIGTTLTTASASRVSIIGVQSCKIFWQVGSSATLGTGTTFRGNIFALTSNTLTTGTTVDGRVLARNGAVTLDTNVITRSRCDTAAPRITVVGAPGDGVPGNPVDQDYNRCVPSDFRLWIRARDPSGIRRVSVFLDGRLIKRTTHSGFYVWVRAAALLPGHHTLRIVARDRVGNVRVQTRGFTRCSRTVLPLFTGRSLSTR